MPDITQTLGFEASQAIANINLLNTALQSLNEMLGNTGTSISQWNSIGGTAVSQFKAMENAATAAKKAIEALTNAQSQAATASSKAQAATSSVGAINAPPPDLSNYVQQIQQLGDALGSVPMKASDASKRAYASAISNLAQFASANKLSLDQVTAAWNNNGTVVTGAANKAANLAQSVKTAHQQMANEAANATRGIGLSWQQMYMIMQATAVHTLIRGFISLLQEGVRESVDFGKRIAEDVTIMGDPFKKTQGDIRELGDTIIEMSNKYGVAAKDIAEGYYQELSARVGTTTESIMVLDQALKFSIATNTSLADSDKALTAVLNSYGLAAGDAAHVTDVLFTAVQRGRYHANELADTLGRVLPVAKEMGASFEEVMATMDTMTIAGVKVDTAATQLRAVFNQLLKPTKELKDLMKSEWGVENAQQAITLFGGLVPLLQNLSEHAHGSTQEMSEFFKNIRAMTGVLQTTGGHAQKLAENFNAMKNAQEGVVEAAAKLVLDTPAKQAEKAWTELKNTFMDTGARLLPSLILLAEGFTAIVKNVDLLRGALTLLVGIGVTRFFTTFATGATTATSALAGLKAMILGINPYFAAFAAGFAIGELIKPSTMDWGKELQKQKDSQEKQLAELSKFLAKQRDLLRQADTQQNKEAQQVVSAMTLLMQPLNSALQSQNKAFVDTIHSRLNDMLKAEESVIQHLDTIIAGSIKKQQELNQEQSKQNMTYLDREFQFRLLGQTEWVQLKMKSDQAESLMTLGLSNLRIAKTEEEINAAKQLIEEGGKYAKNATDQAIQMGYSGSMLESYHNRERNYYTALNAVINQRRQLISQEQAAAEARAPIERQVYEDMKQAVAEITEGLKRYNTEGAKSPEQMEAGFKKAEEAMGRLPAIIERSLGGKKLDMAQQLGLLDLASKIAAFGAQLPSIKVQIEADFTKFNAQFLGFSKLVPESMKKLFPDFATMRLPDWSTELSRLTSEIQQQRTQLDSYAAGMKIAGTAAKELTDRIDTMYQKTRISPTFMEASPFAGPGVVKKLEEFRASYNEILKQTQEALKLPPGTAESYNAIVDAFSKLTAYQKTFNAELTRHPELQSNLAGIQKLLSNIVTQESELREKKLSLGFDENSLQALEQKRDAILQFFQGIRAELLKMPEGAAALEKAMGGVKDASKGASDGAAQLDRNISSSDSAASDLASTLAEVASYAWSAADAMAQASGGQFAAFGGSIRGLAMGGRGTDTVPVMLTPGEFVMNAQASRRFYSQLVGMNAGLAPQGRAEGGSVTNFGDINVSVTGGGPSRQTAREIATALRRELRRGTSKL